MLTPFEVSTDKDTGYVAASSLAGGRADTPLKLTPASISVMTKEFMDDLNITNVAEAMGWTVNVETRTQASLDSGPFGAMEMNFRNVGGAGSYPTRNYFQFYYVSDGFNTERLEFARGPNALLYGDSSIGGIAGQLTKQARFNDRRGETRFQVDSFGGFRSTADLSYGNDKIALRVNGLFQRLKPFQNETYTNTNAIHLAGSYKLAEKTTFRAEMEWNRARSMLYQRTYPENASYWDRATFNNDNSALLANNGTALTNAGLSQISATNAYLVYNFSMPQNGILNYAGNQYQSRGTGFRIPWDGRTDIPRFARLPAKDFNLGPKDATAEKVLNTHAFYVDHRFSDDWVAQIAYASMTFGPTEQTTDQTGNNYVIDVNKLLPNGLTNPNVGKPYAEVTMGRQYQENQVKDIRALTTFKFERPNLFGLKQRFIAIGGYRYDYFEMFTRATRWVNNPAQINPTNSVNQIRYRIYWDQPLPYIGSKGPTTIPGAIFQEVGTGFSTRDNRQLIYGQVVSSTTFWNDRLSLIAGTRRDQLNIEKITSYGNDPVTGKLLFGLFDPKTNANVEGLHAHLWPKQTSNNFGAVFFLLPWVGLVANSSQNFAVPTAGALKIDGTVFDPAIGKGKDFGLKFSLLDNRVYATASYYDTQQTGSIIGGGNVTEMNRIWTNLGYTDTGHTAINYRDIQSIAAKGYEFEVVANLTRNFRMTVNHARPQQKLIEARAGQKGYVAANLKEWQNGAAGIGTGGRTVQNTSQIAADVQTVQDALNGIQTGALADGTLKSTTNIAGTYSFHEGMLKNFSFGGGAQFRGARKQGSVDAQILYGTTTPTAVQTHDAAFKYLYVPSTTIVEAHMSYDYRFSSKIRARFQLNIANLLDDHSPQWSSFSTLAANALLNNNPRMQVLSGFVQFDPRKFTLTSTFSF